MQWQVLFAFGLCSPLFQAAVYLENDYVIDHVEPVLNFRISGKNENSRTLTSGHHQPHSDQIQISFTAFNKDWNFDLEVYHGIYSSNTVFNFIGDEHIVIKPNHTVYKTKAGHFPVATVNIHDDDTIHAMIGTEEDHFTIDPVSMFPEFDLNSKMGIFRYDHVPNMKIKFPSYSTGSRSLLQQTFQSPLPATYPKSADPAQATDSGDPTKWKNCNQNLETGDLKFSMGFAITNEYYSTKGDNSVTGIQQEIQNLLADSNTIYTPQMGVHLYVETADIRTTTSTAGAPWNRVNTQKRNSGCGQTASAALDEFRTWREAKTGAEDVGLWHLMTTCFPPSGTVGIAYLRALCRPVIASGLTSSGTRFTWTVLAHEIGHNFGAEHSFELGQGRTGGIMDYGPGTLGGIYQFNSVYRERQICQTISSSINQQINNQGTTLCWDTYNPQTAQDTYEWKIAADEAVCSVTCGTGTESTPYRCFRTSPPPEIKVADGNCTLTKPQATTGTCTKAACPTARCGDGVVQVSTGEECDPRTPSSCCVQCKVVVSNDCSMKFDSCFNSVKNVGDTYCFSGSNYYKYALADYKQLTGYPRNIAQFFPGLPTNFGTAGVDFTKDIDAVVQRKEGRLYFIKGPSFVVYELGFGTHNTLPDNPQMLTKLFFGLKDGWEKIEAAVSTRSGLGGAYLFRQVTLGEGADQTVGFEYCGFRFGGVCSDARPITDWNGGNAWPMPGITSALRYWPEAGLTTPAVDASVDMFYQGQYVRYKFGVGLTIPNPVNVPKPTRIEEIDVGEPGCTVGCLSCPNNRCSRCDVDFDLVNGKCQPQYYVVEMLFDTDTFAADKIHVGVTSVQDTVWNNVLGNVKQAVTLASSDYISLDVSRLPTDMQDFEFHFWVKLNNDASVSPINLVALDLNKGSTSYLASFYLRAFDSSDVNNYRAYYQIVNKADSNSRVESLGIPKIPKNTWVHLIATLEQGMISCTIEGEEVELPFVDLAADAESSGSGIEYWTFNEFIIGETKTISANSITTGFQGISGNLDQFHIDQLGSIVGDKSSSDTMAYPFFLLLFVAAVFQL